MILDTTGMKEKIQKDKNNRKIRKPKKGQKKPIKDKRKQNNLKCYKISLLFFFFHILIKTHIISLIKMHM